MGKASKRKGAAGERQAAELLRQIWPDAKRGLGQARSGHEIADVEGCPVRLEVKVGKRPDILGAIMQAQRDAKIACDPRPVMVLSHRDREGWLATVPAEFMLLLLDKYYNNKDTKHDRKEDDQSVSG